VRQGELYWLAFPGGGPEPRGRRPALVVQHDRFNASSICTIVVAAVTSNIGLAAAPGNVRLRRGEANLPVPSVVNVSALRAMDRSRFGEHIGTLSPARMRQVLEGIALIFGLELPPE
jgi:mRNA interferase MazF